MEYQTNPMAPPFPLRQGYTGSPPYPQAPVGYGSVPPQGYQAPPAPYVAPFAAAPAPQNYGAPPPPQGYGAPPVPDKGMAISPQQGAPPYPSNTFAEFEAACKELEDAIVASRLRVEDAGTSESVWPVAQIVFVRLHHIAWVATHGDPASSDPPGGISSSFPPSAHSRIAALAHSLGTLPGISDFWRNAIVPSSVLQAVGISSESDELEGCRFGGGAGGVTGPLLLSSVLRMVPSA